MKSILPVLSSHPRLSLCIIGIAALALAVGAALALPFASDPVAAFTPIDELFNEEDRDAPVWNPPGNGGNGNGANGNSGSTTKNFGGVQGAQGAQEDPPSYTRGYPARYPAVSWANLNSRLVYYEAECKRVWAGTSPTDYTDYDKHGNRIQLRNGRKVNLEYDIVTKTIPVTIDGTRKNVKVTVWVRWVRYDPIPSRGPVGRNVEAAYSYDEYSSGDYVRTIWYEKKGNSYTQIVHAGFANPTHNDGQAMLLRSRLNISQKERLVSSRPETARECAQEKDRDATFFCYTNDWRDRDEKYRKPYCVWLNGNTIPNRDTRAAGAHAKGNPSFTYGWQSDPKYGLYPPQPHANRGTP